MFSLDKKDTPKDDDISHEEDGEISDREPSRPESSHSDADTATVIAPNVADPPLPSGEEPPPLPNQASSGSAADDGWEPIWDDRAQAFYFFNKITNVSQWENPRVPDAPKTSTEATPVKRAGGYDPAIHGDYDPNADYAKAYEMPGQEGITVGAPGTNSTDAYAATGAFNRFTGKWQNADINPEKYTDEQKSKRQMNAFFDVDAAANSHDGRSLRAERASKKLSKAELKAFKEKRREKKEEKRRAWLRD